MDTGEKIIREIGALVPKLTEIEKEKFLSFAEGMAFMAKKNAVAADEEPATRPA